MNTTSLVDTLSEQIVKVSQSVVQKAKYDKTYTAFISAVKLIDGNYYCTVVYPGNAGLDIKVGKECGFVPGQYVKVTLPQNNSKFAFIVGSDSGNSIDTDSFYTKEDIDKRVIVSMVEEFCISNSRTEPPVSGSVWVTERPDVSDVGYIWRRVKVTYGNGVVEYTPGEDGVCISGGSGSDGEDATVVRIDSSRGTVFKNNAVETVLTVTVQKGPKIITDIATLKEEYGVSARIEWLWQRIGETTFKTILSTDSRITNDGFTFTISAADVDTKVVFECQLITD